MKNLYINLLYDMITSLFNIRHESYFDNKVKETY